jgi:hypothetical protein
LALKLKLATLESYIWRFVHCWQLGSACHLLQFIFRYFDELFVVGATHRIQLDLSKFMVIQVVHDLSPSKPEASPAKEPDLRRLGCDHDRGSFHNSADDVADIKAAASDLFQLFISQFVVGEFTISGVHHTGSSSA